jgi:hypothetical protein
MKSRLLAVFILTCLAGSVGRARPGGDVVGNGGDAILCTNGPQESSAFLFDYFEANIFEPGIKFDFGPQAGVQNKIDYVLNRLAKVSPQRAAQYRAFIASIFNPEHFVDTDLVPIDDSHNYVMPKNCQLVQLAVHLKPAYDPYRRKVLIDRRVYGLLSEEHQAGIFLHEAIYNEVLSLSDRDDSSGVRFMNSAISSPGDLTLGPFAEILRRAGLQEYEYHGIWLELTGNERSSTDPWNLQFYGNGALKSAYYMAIVPGEVFDHDRPLGINQDLALKSGLVIHILDRDEGTLQFREDGTISEIQSHGIHTTLQKQWALLLNAHFDEEENLVAACVHVYGERERDKYYVPLELRTAENKMLNLDSSAQLTFDKNGLVLTSQFVRFCPGLIPLP